MTSTSMLKHGAHERPEDGVCAMEAVAWIAGERHSDSPECCSPIIARFLRHWNDSLPDSERDILVPLLPFVVGTRADESAELRRSWLAYDWLVRTHAPAWMMLSESLEHHATRLQALPEVMDDASFRKAEPVLAAAWDAAGAAARDAAWHAAGAVAGAAAWGAAGAAAGHAAWGAAGAVAGDAARDAAGAVAGDAAWHAAWQAVGATKLELQRSACDLVLRMVAVAPGSPPALLVSECPYLVADGA